MTRRPRPLVERVALSLYGVWGQGDPLAKAAITRHFDARIDRTMAEGALREARRILRLVAREKKR